MGAFTRSFIDGGASASRQPAQNAIVGAVGVVNRTATWASGAFRGSDFIAQGAVGAEARAIQPRLVIVFPGLNMKTHGHEAVFALGIRSGPAPPTTAEIAGNLLTGDENSAPIPVPVMIPITIVVAILIAVLRRRQCGECHQEENGEGQCKLWFSAGSTARRDSPAA